jgi:glycosyltransferase involved in cell wall biosynthesis
MKVVVTIPAYNEEKTIGKVILGIRKVMDSANYKYRIMVVDDGSRDDTSNVSKKAGAVVYSHQTNHGLAETFKTEIGKALLFNPDVIVHIDADGQYRAEEIPNLIKEVENGYDLVLGSRFKGKIESMPLIKRMGNKAFSKVISNVTGFKISDAQTGFRAFNRKVAEKVKVISTHTYTQEQIIRAIRSKFRIKEVPIYFGRRLSGKSRLMKNPIDYAIKAWINILRINRDYEPLKFFGMIGSFFLFVGLMIGAWFTYLHFTTGIEGHLGMLMLMLLSIISGIQIIIFGFLADMNKL